MSVVGNPNKYVVALRRFEKKHSHQTLIHASRNRFRWALSKFCSHCFTIGAYRTFVGSLFIVVVIGRFDARQEQLQSATWTPTSGNRSQRGGIRTIWLWHGTLPYCLAQAGE